MFFKPQTFVTRVIFIATPHRGSCMASKPIVKFGNKFLNLPGGVAKTAVQIGKLRQPIMIGRQYTILTALDNMDASNPFITTLSATPIAGGVHVHSIIPVKGAGSAEDGNDGGVEYKSAHIGGAESELIVRYGHSTQATSQTEHAGIY